MPAWGWFATWLAGMAGLVVLASTVVVPRVEARGRDTDQRILENLHEAIAPLVSGPIVLTVIDREVALEGDVPTIDEHDAIVAAAGAGEDVRGIVDRLVVTDGSTAGTVPEAPTETPAEAPAEPSIAPLPASSPEPGVASGPDPEALPEPLPDVVDDPAPPSGAPSLKLVDELGDDLLSDEESLALAAPDAAPPTGFEPGGPDGPAPEAPEASVARAPSAPTPLPRAEVAARTGARPASLSLRLVDGALKLDGAVGQADAARLAAFTGPAIEAFDPTYLENTVQTPGDVASAPWLDALTRLLVPLAALGTPAVDIGADRLVLGGDASSDTVREAVIDAAGTLFPNHTLVERIAVTPDGVGNGRPDRLAPAGAIPDAPRADPDSGTDPDAPAGLAAGPDGATAEADPAAARAALQRDFESLDDRDILFGFGTATFAGDSAAKVETIAALLRRHPGVRVEIEGHTDASGGARANLALSQQRANAVRDALVTAGVSRDRLVAYGYGEGVPLADNTTSEGRARNRRIEFRF